MQKKYIMSTFQPVPGGAYYNSFPAGEREVRVTMRQDPPRQSEEIRLVGQSDMPPGAEIRVRLARA